MALITESIDECPQCKLKWSKNEGYMYYCELCGLFWIYEFGDFRQAERHEYRKYMKKWFK